MYCPSCGEEIPDDSEFCQHCGEHLSRSEKGPESTPDTDVTTDSTNQWNPAFPITSVFVAILFAWVTLDLSTPSGVFMFGLPGILVIPRVRRYVIRWVNERYDRDLTTGRIKGVGMVAYAILMFLALAFVIGSTANEPTVGGSPTRQVTVGILTIGIMFGIAAAIVTAIRMNRKLRN